MGNPKASPNRWEFGSTGLGSLLPDTRALLCIWETTPVLPNLHGDPTQAAPPQLGLLMGRDGHKVAEQKSSLCDWR